MNGRSIGNWINASLFGDAPQDKCASTKSRPLWFWLAAGLFWFIASLIGGSIVQKIAGDTTSLVAGLLTASVLTITGSLVTIWLSGSGPTAFTPKNKILAAFSLWATLILIGLGTTLMLQLTITALLGMGILVLGALLTTWLSGSNPSHSYIKARALTAYWLSFIFSFLVTLIGCLAIWVTATSGPNNAGFAILLIWMVILGPIFGLAFYGTSCCFEPKIPADIAKD